MFMEIEIPSQVQIEVKGDVISTKGSLGSNTRRFNDALLKVAKDGNKLAITPITDKKLAKKAMMAERSLAKEMANDMNGVTKHFEINMQVVFAHFPITIEVKGDTINIKNIIGERAPRTSRIVGSTKVEVKGQSMRLYGTNLDDVSQTAANLRKTCKIVDKDSRIFQDGVYYAIE